jgi:hypothetical protein
MKLEVVLPPIVHPEQVMQTVLQCASGLRLRCSLNATSPEYPGSYYWLFGKGSQDGVVVIYWPSEHKLWLEAEEGWAGNTAKALGELMEGGFRVT